jgi:hypothetical protein
MEAIVQAVTLCDGVVYGEYVRDMLIGLHPTSADAYFGFEVDYELFIAMTREIEQIADDIIYFTNGCILRCVVGMMHRISYECNTLVISNQGMYSTILDPHDVVGLMNIIQNIRNRIAWEIFPNPVIRVHMRHNGWTVKGEHIAANIIKRQFKKAISDPHYAMCKNRLERESEEIIHLV